MGLPVLATMAVVTGVLATGVAAYGQVQAGQAARQQALYSQGAAQVNAEISRRNAEVQARNAEYAEVAGARQMDERARRIRSLQGAQRAAAAANGLLVDSGSVSDILDDTSRLGGMAIDEIREGSDRQAQGFRIAEQNARVDADLGLLRGRALGDQASAAGTAGWLSAGGTILGGASRSFDAFADMRRSGMRNNNPPQVT